MYAKRIDINVAPLEKRVEEPHKFPKSKEKISFCNKQSTWYVQR